MKLYAPTAVDGYKTGHPEQYPNNSVTVAANFTPRGSRVAGCDKVTFVGLQYFIKEYLVKNWNDTFFSIPKEEAIRKYKRLMVSYLGSCREDSLKRLDALHDLGYLPLEIWALPEGSNVNLRVPMFQVYNTNPNILDEFLFYWITNNIETIVSTTSWLPCTSATTARMYRKLLDSWADKTNPEMKGFVPYQGHDFSYRGHGSNESAMTSGFGHALFFVGSDTFPVIQFAEEYYGANCEKEVIIQSVPATEHSVMCMGGDKNEVETFRRLIEDVYKTHIVSIVSDTWDFWEVVNPDGGICAQLKDKIMARDGKVVIRPDSGDPVKIVTGYMEDELVWSDVDDSFVDRVTLKPVTELEIKGMIQCLHEIFDGTETSTGYIQLDSHIGAIYGDAITLERADQICSRLEQKGFASTNIVFGIGSFTYQGAITSDAIVTRDTFGFAMKSTYGELLVDGNVVGIEIFKDPKTDDGLKTSAKGLCAVYKTDAGDFYLKDQATWEEVFNCEFVRVFVNGVLPKEWSLADVRATAEASL